MQNLLQSAYNLLKSDPRLISTEGDLLKNKIQELAYKLDEELIGLLLGDETMRSKFFITIRDVLVFDQSKFVQFISNKEFLPDSYTSYKNKIGLVDTRGDMIHETNDVVLNRPYKDCVLAGGQDSEDAKRDELFYNEILGSDDIDRLLDPKVFTNITKYTAEGAQPLTGWNRSEDGTITDNLIIKGNNLLALASLQSQFAGKVKLIYIDPPYNTGNDGFKYNDKFNHSTRLTFMKNRLEQAKTLLRDDGVIFVQCDDNEQAYLKVLMDGVFNETFLNTIIVKAKSTSGASGGGEDKKIKKNTEYIHLYYKGASFDKLKDQYSKIELIKYIQGLKDSKKSFSYNSVLVNEGDVTYVKSTKDGRGDEIKIFKHDNYVIKTINQLSKDEGLDENVIYIKYFNKIFTTENAQTSIRDRLIDATDKEDNFYTIEYSPVSGKNKGEITRVGFIGKTKRLVSYLSSSCLIEKGCIYKMLKMGTLWDDMSRSSISREGDVNFENGKKPEKLLRRIIDMATDEGDIVLDYHLGSGTTCAVAHKMRRQYIGIEQINLQIELSLTRLNNVIQGDETGISALTNRSGGGEFVYMETMKHNQHLIDQINTSDNVAQLTQIYDELLTSPWINYRVQLSAVSETANERAQLEISQMKQLLINMIDQNSLYVNYSEIRDASYAVSDADRKLNDEFYQ